MRYFVKAEGTLFSFPPEIGFSYFYIVDNLLLLFWDDQHSLICQIFLNKAADQFYFIYLFNFIYFTSYFFSFNKFL